MSVQDTIAPNGAISNSNSRAVLAELATRAEGHYERYRTHESAAVEAYISAGHDLLEAKNLVPHGGWLSHLKRTGIPVRTTQRMMQLASCGIKSDTVTYLGGVSAVLRDPDQARLVQEMLAELDQLRDKRAEHAEREAIMFESATPKARDQIEKIFAQDEQIRELRAALNGHMTEHAQLKREARALKHRMRSLENQVAKDG